MMIEDPNSCCLDNDVGGLVVGLGTCTREDVLLRVRIIILWGGCSDDQLFSYFIGLGAAPQNLLLYYVISLGAAPQNLLLYYFISQLGLVDYTLLPCWSYRIGHNILLPYLILLSSWYWRSWQFPLLRNRVIYYKLERNRRLRSRIQCCTSNCQNSYFCVPIATLSLLWI